MHSFVHVVAGPFSKVTRLEHIVEDYGLSLGKNLVDVLVGKIHAVRDMSNAFHLIVHFKFILKSFATATHVALFLLYVHFFGLG